MLNIDFFSESFQFLAHPRFEDEAAHLTAILKSKLPGHFALFSSGTTSDGLKGYAVSKTALMKNAEAVNKHFNLSEKDIWGLSLPLYHIGGLSVVARAQLLKNKLVDLRKWNPVAWLNLVTEERITITTIVPTQLYDLVRHKFKSPPSLRLLIVGGDFLSRELENQAMALGWPVIRTFGMSEVCSQLASARTPGGSLEILPIHQVKTDEDQKIWVKSQSLYSMAFNFNNGWEFEFSNPDEFYPTQDRGTLSGNTLEPLGRLDDHFKMGGHLINLLSLKETLAGFLLANGLYGLAELSIQNDERQGKKVELLYLPALQDNVKKILELFSPVKVEATQIESFDRTDLGKLKRSK